MRDEFLSHGELKKALGLWQDTNENIFFQRYRIGQLVA